MSIRCVKIDITVILFKKRLCIKIDSHRQKILYARTLKRFISLNLSYNIWI